MYKYDNEKEFAQKLIMFESNLVKVKNHIKENFNVDSEYVDNDDIIYIWSNKSGKLNEAKEYILNQLGNDFIDVIYGKKQ